MMTMRGSLAAAVVVLQILLTKVMAEAPIGGGVVMVDEYEKYQCGSPNASATMAACFCGFLEDAEGPEEITSAEMLLPSQCINGQAAGTYPCLNVHMHAHLPLGTFDSFRGNDVWGWTDEGTGREFALMGLQEGVAMVEITNPQSPVYLGRLDTNFISSSWRDIKVYKDHAFIVSEAILHGMQVFDLNQLLNVASPPTSFSPVTVYNDMSAHNIVINEETGYAYLVGSSECFGGLYMVDISTPSAPVFAGCFSDDGYVHDAHCVIYQGPDDAHVGKEICVCCNEDTITIVDVTNKANAVQLSRTPYANAGYTHQGWLTPNHEYVVFGDETDERSFPSTRTLVMNVQNLDQPLLAGEHFGTTAATDHNLYIDDNNLIYLSNYRAGLRILQINDLQDAGLEEVGYFDIYPSSDSNAFNGAWSVYPYFPSGTIVVSGIEQGLFVLEFDNPNAPTAAPTPASCLGDCGDCSQELGTPECECPACYDRVCAQNSFCCNVRWDDQCVNDARRLCECAPTSTPTAAPTDACPANTCGNCNEGRPNGGCGCDECQRAVCAADRYCCTKYWDRDCVRLATSLCDTCPAPVPTIAPTTQAPTLAPTLFPTAQPTPCLPSCPEASGSGCGFCYLTQRRNGCSSCAVCEQIVCSLDEGAKCCAEGNVWDAACVDLATRHCSCCR